MKQRQFLDVVPLAEAKSRWHGTIDLEAVGAERVPLGSCLGRVLADDVLAPGDVPAFDRANVDGFAVRAEDTYGASEGEPTSLRVVGVGVAAGHAADTPVTPGTAVVVATGAPIPRGADAMVMVEDTEVDGDTVRVTAAAVPGARLSAAGSDIARGETLLRAGTPLTARETGTLAACGIDAVDCRRRVRVAVISTGDEIVAPGEPLALGQVHDANATLVADTVREMGGDADVLGIAPDDEASIRALLERAKRDYDLTILSGGTSKGQGDLSYGVLAGMAEIVVHGVALKPGKPLCLAAWERKPVAVLPGFPTSAIFTFHAVVAPVLRRLMGRSEEARATVRATLGQHVRSERGRAEFSLLGLVRGTGGLVAYPLGKGSGSVTTFARADGFFEVPANVEYADAGDEVTVTLLGHDVTPAVLTVVGSHCLGLDTIVGHVFDAAGLVKVIAAGSKGGIAAIGAGACDVAPVHLLDPETETWNAPFAPDGTRVLRGYGRSQGVAYRGAHAAHFEGDDVEAAMQKAAADPALRIANRNPGSGTRLLVDQLLAS
ncbi:MAG: molybdopterin biosynthesis protein, partial [Planctomycetota bacterium]|nr:molybdopterin biosynthesis protein [Planctomycetota bacterium]